MQKTLYRSNSGPTSILISEPERRWADELRSFLRSKSYNVEVSLSGMDCQLKIYKKKYYAVVLDIETQNHSGFEVLRYLRLNAPSVKVILTVPTKKRLNELELSEAELKKLGVSDIVIKPYSLDKLHQSIQGLSQFESWKNIPSSQNPREEETIELDDDEFTRIDINHFYSGNTTIFDCYIKLATNKYVKILHQGDFFDEKRIQKYEQGKNIEYLYFRTSDRGIYINFINNLLEKLIVAKSVPIEKKVHTAKILAEKYIEEIYTSGLTPGLVSEGKQLCQSICSIIQRDVGLSKLLASYEDYDPPAYTHLFLVSFFSAIICHNLEWATRRTMELITFGALLHDVGTLKLPEEMRNISPEHYDNEQWKIYKEHPQHGIDMLQKHSLVTEPIRQIIYQHHEYVNGEGFPNGLTGLKIYPLAKVVAFSDELATLIASNRITPIAGLKQLIPDRYKMARFDPLVVKALVRGFIRNRDD